jgi:type I restriction enzyme M protein
VLSKNCKIISVSDLKNSIVDYFIRAKEIKVSDKAIGKYEIIDTNCLLISTNFKHLKPTYYIHEGEDVCISSGIKPFIVDESIISSEYLISQFYEPYFLKQLDSVRRGTSQQFFSINDFLQLKIKLPSPEQQARIYEASRESFLTQKVEEAEIIKQDLTKQIAKVASEQVNIISSIQHELGNKLPALKNTLDDLKRFFKYYSNKNASFSIDTKIRDILPGENPDEIDSVKDILDRSEKILNYTISMVDDAGGIINSDPSRFNPQRTNLSEFIITEINNLRRIHANYINVQFEVSSTEEVWVLIDKKQISVALNNLIQNAVRHGFVEKDRKYNIAFQFIPDDNFLTLIVKNDGIPFPKDFTIEKYKQPYLFAGKSGNSGLGGFIINRIIENHGASMDLKKDIDPADNFKVQFEFRFPNFYL